MAKLTSKSGCYFNFAQWYTSPMDLNQAGFDELVGAAIELAPRRLVGPSFDRYVETILGYVSFDFLGDGDHNDQLTGRSEVWVPNNVVIPEGVEIISRRKLVKEGPKGRGQVMVLAYDPSEVVRTSGYIEYNEGGGISPMEEIVDFMRRLIVSRTD